MKRKTAKEILSESFRELAENKSIDKITVKEITDNCGYSSATFYRQFKDKYDLIAWDYTQGIAEFMNQIGKEGYTWKQTLIDGANSLRKEKDYLTNLLLHTSGHDSFIFYMIEINYNALKNHILKVSGENDLDEETEIYIRIYCLGTVNLTCEWILGKYKISPEEIAKVYENSLPEPLHKYLI